MAWTKPRPNIDSDNQEFWAGLREHRFLLMRCKQCGAYYWPASYCRFHRNEPFRANMEWVAGSGRGRIFAFNIHHVAFHPGFKDELPYVYALIELDEGPMFGTTIIGCPPGAVHIGMPVEVEYEDVAEEGFTLPRMRPQALGSR